MTDSIESGVDGSDEAARIRRVYEARDAETDWLKYSVASPGALFIQQQRTRAIVRLLVDEGYFPLTEIRVLDVGCGHGSWLVELESWGANGKNLAGIDLDPERIARARERVPGADIRQGDGTSLPWPDGSFDLVLQSTVFTSILDEAMRTAVAAEMARVMAPTGAILWYDFFRDNPGNADVRGVRSDEIRRLFPGLMVSLRRTTLAPPIARRLAPRSWVAATAFESMRALNTHYLGLIRRPEDPSLRAQGRR